jgi:hypothetical protein
VPAFEVPFDKVLAVVWALGVNAPGGDVPPRASHDR